MPNIDAPTRPVLEENIAPDAIEDSIRAAMTNYNQRFGSIRHVWVHPKDVPADLLMVDGVSLERKAGCPRRKVWVM
jgi:hypothetical protein